VIKVAILVHALGPLPLIAGICITALSPPDDRGGGITFALRPAAVHTARSETRVGKRPAIRQQSGAFRAVDLYNVDEFALTIGHGPASVVATTRAVSAGGLHPYHEARAPTVRTVV
jgi:hypothetical protein